jgi:hypothetical protein
MLTLITPSCRPGNLPKVFDTIHFDKIDEWIIVHDTTKTNGVFKPVFSHPKITELGHVSPPGTCSGNSQRNVALSRVKSGMVYFLDDDNAVHSTFWTLIDKFDEDHFYTWDQQRNDMFANKPDGVMSGEEPRLRKIDTAQYIIPRHMCRPWPEGPYWADGLFIEDVYSRFKDKHVYIPVVAAVYNYFR